MFCHQARFAEVAFLSGKLAWPIYTHKNMRHNGRGNSHHLRGKRRCAFRVDFPHLFAVLRFRRAEANKAEPERTSRFSFFVVKSDVILRLPVAKGNLDPPPAEISDPYSAIVEPKAEYPAVQLGAGSTETLSKKINVVELARDKPSWEAASRWIKLAPK